MTEPIREVLLKRLVGTHADSAYMHASYGSLFCGGNDIHPLCNTLAKTLHEDPGLLYGAIFNSTAWAATPPKTLCHGFGIYVACGQFFVQGATLQQQALCMCICICVCV